jgi:hypothetical protein
MTMNHIIIYPPGHPDGHPDKWLWEIHSEHDILDCSNDNLNGLDAAENALHVFEDGQQNYNE